MGTRTFITKEIGNGKYRAILCSMDGYLEITGELLTKFYNTPEKVDALLSLGDICYLGEKLTPDPAQPHNDCSYQEDVTLAYGRDCGDMQWSTAQEMSISDIINYDDLVEFVYVFTLENEWRYWCPLASDVRFRSVTEALLEDGIADITEPEEQIQNL